MSTYPHYPKRPHDTNGLLSLLLIAAVVFIIILVVTN
jgi:hypothetical protein